MSYSEHYGEIGPVVGQAAVTTATLVDGPDTAAHDTAKARPTPLPWDRGEYRDGGGYDTMYGGITIGPVTLDGVDYGQTPWEPITAAQLAQMEADADVIAAARESAEDAARYLGLLQDCRPYLVSLEARITHPCPLRDATHALWRQIDAELERANRCAVGGSHVEPADTPAPNADDSGAQSP